MKKKADAFRLSLAQILQSEKTELVFEEREESRVLNAAMGCGVVCRTRRTPDGTVVFTVAQASAGKLLSRLSAIGCKPLSLSGPGRARRLWRRIGRRSGLLAGALLFLALTAFFSSVLWKIEITGCQKLKEEEVLAQLSECGVREGAFLRGIDADRVRNEMMQKNGGIAWMSVNVIGTYAYVEIRETERKAGEAEGGYSHIVASCDGQILSFETRHGNVLLWPGDTVREGELIVAGMIEQMNGDYKLVHAEGKVIARTEHTVAASCPYLLREETEGKRTLTAVGIRLFGKMINISLNRRLDADQCDIIHKKETPALPFGLSLPGVFERTYLSKKNQTETLLTREEAAARAKETAYRTFAATYPEAEMIARRIRVEYGEDACTVTLFAVCRENIAKIVTFTAGE
ncbi:MAG: sporulation protein YqfD [Clostridia bacterium]|nr:sporulation protein YqfD [Clostridia bacterium]